MSTASIDARAVPTAVQTVLLAQLRLLRQLEAQRNRAVCV
jgi:hypothetical protein